MAFVPDTEKPWLVSYQIKNDNGTGESGDDMEICIGWWMKSLTGAIKQHFILMVFECSCFVADKRWKVPLKDQI